MMHLKFDTDLHCVICLISIVNQIRQEGTGRDKHLALICVAVDLNLVIANDVCQNDSGWEVDCGEIWMRRDGEFHRSFRSQQMLMKVIDDYIEEIHFVQNVGSFPRHCLAMGCIDHQHPARCMERYSG